MQDNDRPNVVQIVRNYIEEVEINTIAWPARSPDWNLTENLWDILDRRTEQPAGSRRQADQDLETSEPKWNKVIDFNYELWCESGVRGSDGNIPYAHFLCIFVRNLFFFSLPFFKLYFNLNDGWQFATMTNNM